ncbi:lysozyme [Mesorhizobium sp. M0050]|uniref:lysozyme n=1 Tax=Mesorhizobium sp. M0050 TaxID=2956861 RepID=UPI0033377344
MYFRVKAAVVLLFGLLPLSALAEGDQMGVNASAVRDLPPLAFDIIRDFEGWSEGAVDDPENFCIIGYGHLIAQKPCSEVPKLVAKYPKVLSWEDGKKLLESDTIAARMAVSRLISPTLSENQFGALVAFVFNVGSHNLERSRMRSLLNDEEFVLAAKEFPKWVKIHGRIVDILVNRRLCEQDLFLDQLTPPFDRADCAPFGASPPSDELIDIVTGNLTK